MAAQSGLLPTACVQAQTNLTPEGAFQELLAGNARSAADRLTSIEQDLKILREHTVDGQQPFAGVLACADSRVAFSRSAGIFRQEWSQKIVKPFVNRPFKQASALRPTLRSVIPRV
jgi:hypothetical protein